MNALPELLFSFWSQPLEKNIPTQKPGLDRSIDRLQIFEARPREKLAAFTMSSRRFKKSECAHENCGSRRFHVGEDGFTYCDRGHQQSERGTVIAEDTGEFVVLGRKSKKQDSDAESATSRGMAMKCKEKTFNG